MKTMKLPFLELPVDLLKKAGPRSQLDNFLKQTTLPSTPYVETNVFRDRDPGSFHQIVQFLQSDNLSPFGVEDYKKLVEEAKFFNLPALEKLLKKRVFQSPQMERPFSRRDKRRPESGRQRFSWRELTILKEISISSFKLILHLFLPWFFSFDRFL